LIDAGKLPASPMPRANRAAMKPATDALYERPTTESIAATPGPNSRTSACAIAARLQITMTREKPRRAPSLSISRPASSMPMAYASWKARTMSA
jgi:hypothetical protein